LRIIDRFLTRKRAESDRRKDAFESVRTDIASQSEGRLIRVQGAVQGVGFRPFVYRLAREEGLAGRVWNDSAGVAIEAFGPHDALERFASRLMCDGPLPSRLDHVLQRSIGFETRESFEIVESDRVAGRRVSIPADIAICPECLAEIFDPLNRRFRYAFTNCTNCGPRFTIARDVPYDRITTTMAAFEMCTECRREYDTPDNRRFHCESNACPECGPRLSLWAPRGELVSSGDPVKCAAHALCQGQIVAVKGLGGFHLACDAGSSAAVGCLRARKRRDEKPFAVMVRRLADAERLAVLTAADRELLESPERPVVIVRRRTDAALAPEIAPGSPLVGLIIAYTPLHHLLLAQAQRPMVMTSGNVSEEPIAYRNDEALRRLAGIADLVILHDREIVARCDDSVARLIAGTPTLLRRSRGYVPRPVRVTRPFAEPVLAVGSQLKNTFCLGVDDCAWLGPHVGDLDNLETTEAFEESVERMERFVGVRAKIIAHDLHPDYISTRYALDRSGTIKIAVQHHHAHVASAMAEHGLREPVLGVAYDGTGLGADGAMWGGELLLAGLSEFQRIATFRPIALAGGDRAIRDVWRLAFALAYDAFDGDFSVESLPLFRALDPAVVATVRGMIRTKFNCAAAHGVGRYFDAVGALVFARTTARYEGQVAMMLNNAADDAAEERGTYAFAICRAREPWNVDLRPAVRKIVEEASARKDPRRIAARFHNTLIAATSLMLHAAIAEHGRLPIVLTGGCFQNPLLARGIAAALRGISNVYLHRDVPPGDGGIALGQAMVAQARTL
jgi:hydrogenase maturation protein HypF